MRKFWEIEDLAFFENELKVTVLEMTSSVDDPAPSITILGVTIGGLALRVRENAQKINLIFSDVVEFRALPEQTSWPSYEDGDELISALLYRKSGTFFYGNDKSADYETFGQSTGWVKACELDCYIIHSETFDLYVLSNCAPAIS